MKKLVAKKWIKALRSGQYRQGTQRLKLNGKYCCLGVLNQLYPELNLSDESSRVLWNYKAIGLNSATGTLCWESDGSVMSLARLNDNGFTFDEIADIIQIEYIEGL